MAAYNDNPLFTINGNIGKGAVAKETSKGQVVNFTVAVKTGYSDDASPAWFDVSVWNEGLQAYALANFARGVKVAIEGFYSTREYNGQEYKQISAQQLGLVEWAPRTKRTVASAPVAVAPVAVVPDKSDGEW